MEKQKNVVPLSPKWQDFPDIELYMDQVISVLEKHLSPYFPEEKCITSTMINNYVKQKHLPPPQNKRYGKEQLTRLFMICVLKSFMPLSRISALLGSLSAEKGEEGLYHFFSSQLDLAVSHVALRSALPAQPEEDRERALHTALMAFASILYAKSIFALAEKSFPAGKSEEEKDKKEEKAEKKEKKEKKEKEKK